jgi:hypothetical protein
MEAMLGISLYSNHYLKLHMQHVFLIIAYVFSSTILEKRIEQVLPGSKVFGGERKGEGGKMAQTMYAHMNK